MRTVCAALLWIVCTGPGVHAAAQAMPDTMTFSMRGTLEKYDSTTQTLSVMTRGGAVRLTLVSSTRIRQGRHDIDATALEKLAGFRAVVRYSESAGGKVLQSIHVLEKSGTPRQ
jgi:hypothetical protein